MYSPVLALLERAGGVTICIAGIMLLLGSTKMERVADLSLLCAIDWRQPVPRWYGYCNSRRSTRKEGKLMKALTRIMPSNVGSERQAVFATVCS